MGKEEEIRKIREEIERTPYNKATQKHIGKLKAKLAKLKAEEEKGKASRTKGGGYAVKKRGDATVILVGFPSVGKSTLLNRLTNAESKTGEYDFTTVRVIPGMMEYNGAKIQILDVPGIIEGVSEGKGRGREVMSAVRNADLVLIVVSAEEAGKQARTIRNELYRVGFRLDEKPPDISVEKRNSGGIDIMSSRRMGKEDEKAVKSVLNSFNIYNAEVVIREEFRLERLIDCLMGNRIYVPSITIINKIDIADKIPEEEGIRVSALTGENIELLKREIWNKLEFIRIYLKKIGREPDMEEPLIMKKGCSVMDVCVKIHREFAKNFRYAKIWGSSRFPGQRVGADYQVKDLDIVEIHL